MGLNLNTNSKIIRIYNGEKIPILIYSSLNNRYVWPVMVWTVINRRFSVSFKTSLDDIYYLQKFYNYCNDIELELDRLIIEIEFDPILETYQNFALFY